MQNYKIEMKKIKHRLGETMYRVSDENNTLIDYCVINDVFETIELPFSDENIKLFDIKTPSSYQAYIDFINKQK